MANSSYKDKKKVHFSKEKYEPDLYFYPKDKLEELNQQLLLWSENNSDHRVLEKLLKDASLFHLFAFGETMSGKSNLLEVFAEYQMKAFNRVIIDASGIDYEGTFWAKKYKCYFVYPQLIKPKKTNKNPNVKEIKLNKKNTWTKILRRAERYKRVVVLMCEDPLEASYLRALIKLFKTCMKRELSNIHKICLLREISFFAYKHGTLKVSAERYARDAKRSFIKYVRIGRHKNNMIFCDAQRISDVDGMIGDNVAVKAIKRTDGYIENFPKYISEEIKVLKKWHVIFKVLGLVCTGTIGLSSFHKTEDDKVEDLKVFPTTVDIHRYNKLVENRYIDRVGEYYTNRLGRLILGRRRHLQDPENSDLCMFEIADLLAVEGEININSSMSLKKARLVYGEIKFRSAGSKHPRIETNDVKKTIQDLAVKMINYDTEKDHYFWTLDQQLAKQLGWSMEKEKVDFPVIVEMVSPGGATKGAKALMDRHNIWNRTVKIDEDTFYM